MDRDDQKIAIRDASDIVQVVGEHLTLKAKGREYVGLCPFHNDNNPSMAVVPSKQIFHCFVCGTGGDVFSFVQKYHGMSFPEALKFLADRAGIELAPPTRRARSAGTGDDEHAAPAIGRSEVVAVNRRALEFFRAILRHEEHGAAARALIERRGISPEMAETFQIGAAPDRWDGLTMFAGKQGISEAELAAAGLVKRRDSGGVYDALRNRLIFPICNEAAEPVAFGARRIDDADEPKYLNSPETAVFRKASTMYGLHLARPAIRAEDRAVVVEGYTDVIACHQAGVTNVVATLGTAFTSEHARKLRGLCARVVLLFDGDEAGQRAADRAFEVLFSSRIDVYVATLAGVTDAKDPDELLKREGGDAVFRAAIDEARHLLDHWADRLRVQTQSAGPAARGRIIEDELRRLADLGLGSMRPVDRRLILERAAIATGVPYAELNRALPSGRRAAASPAHTTGDDDTDAYAWPTDGPMTGADWVFACLIARPELAAEHPDAMAEARRAADNGQPWAAELHAAVEFAAEEDPTTGAVLMWLGERSERAKQRAVRLLREVDASTGDDPAEIAGLLSDAARVLRSRREHAEAIAASQAGQAGPTGQPDETAPADETAKSEINTIGDRLARIRAAHNASGGRGPAIPSANPFSRRRDES